MTVNRAIHVKVKCTCHRLFAHNGLPRHPLSIRSRREQFNISLNIMLQFNSVECLFSDIR